MFNSFGILEENHCFLDFRLWSNVQGKEPEYHEKDVKQKK